MVGEAYNSAGDAYNGTTLGLGNTAVTNDGTLVLDAQGSGKTQRWSGDHHEWHDPEQWHHRGRGAGPGVDSSTQAGLTTSTKVH